MSHPEENIAEVSKSSATEPVVTPPPTLPGPVFDRVSLRQQWVLAGFFVVTAVAVGLAFLAQDHAATLAGRAVQAAFRATQANNLVSGGEIVKVGAATYQLAWQKPLARDCWLITAQLRNSGNETQAVFLPSRLDVASCVSRASYMERIQYRWRSLFGASSGPLPPR